jgi:dephospho-CoA kinase
MSTKLKDEFQTKSPETRLYQTPIPIIGISGGIATGKSSFTQVLEQKQFPIICADQIVKTIYQEEASLKFVQDHFPQAIESSKINFRVLRGLVFNNQKNKDTIENYIFSHFERVFKDKLNSFSHPEFVFYDAPLLYEKDLHKLVDTDICVYADRKTQIQRLMARDSIDQNLAEKILQAQLDIEDKKKLAKHLITNMTSLEELEKQTKEIIHKILI